MKFSKHNNPNRRRRTKRISKVEYIPTLQELEYCWQKGVKPEEYTNIKFKEEN